QPSSPSLASVGAERPNLAHSTGTGVVYSIERVRTQEWDDPGTQYLSPYSPERSRMPDDPSLTTVEQHVHDYLTATDALGFNRYTDFDWENLPASIQRSHLTELHISAVETAMLVEDHIPHYGSEYIRLFPIDPDRSDAELWCNRQMLHF